MAQSVATSKLPDSYGKKFDQMFKEISEAPARNKSFGEKGFTAF